MKTYRAPWGTTLIAVSSFITLLCAGVAMGLIWMRTGPRPSLGLLPLLVVGVSALFSIRGYSITPDAILVRRPGWSTRVPLAGLVSARFEPDAMRRSLRTFGNGGLFSFTGYFRNKPLGNYRAFVTDPHHTVVLRFTGRTIVLSPEAPERFVRDLSFATRQSVQSGSG